MLAGERSAVRWLGMRGREVAGERRTGSLARGVALMLARVTPVD